MTAQHFLSGLAMRGVILSAAGDHLDVDGPADLLTDELLATLRARKTELLDILAGGPVQTSVPEAGPTPLLATTNRIRLVRRKYFPWNDPLEAGADVSEGFNEFGENCETHDSALSAVEVTFYDGRRIRIPQQSTPAGWECPF